MTFGLALGVRGLSTRRGWGVWVGGDVREHILPHSRAAASCYGWRILRCFLWFHLCDVFLDARTCWKTVLLDHAHDLAKAFTCGWSGQQPSVA